MQFDANLSLSTVLVKYTCETSANAECVDHDDAGSTEPDTRLHPFQTWCIRKIMSQIFFFNAYMRIYGYFYQHICNIGQLSEKKAAEMTRNDLQKKLLRLSNPKPITFVTVPEASLILTSFSVNLTLPTHHHRSEFKEMYVAFKLFSKVSDESPWCRRDLHCDLMIGLMDMGVMDCGQLF